MGKDLKFAIKLISIGIVIGVILAVIIGSVMDLNLSKVNVGPLEFEASEKTPVQQQNSEELTSESQLEPTAISEPTNTPQPSSTPTIAPTFTPEPSPTDTPQPIATIRQQNIQVNMLGCTLSGSIVTCDFSLFSEDEDVDFHIWASCSTSSDAEMYDNFGNRYLANSIKLANESSSCRAHLRLVAQVWVRGQAVFKDVDPKATGVSLLSLSGAWESLKNDDYTDYPIEFRNIPLVRNE